MDTSPPGLDGTSIDFLKAVYGPSFAGYIPLYQLPEKRTTFFHHSQMDELAETIERLKGVSNIYGTVGTQRERLASHLRGSASTVRQVSSFFVDVDFANNKQSLKTYVRDADAAVVVRRALPLPPSAVVSTGNGEHWHWFNEDPLLIETIADLERAKALSRDFSRKMQGVFREHGAEIDSVGDITRAFRVPGTFNRKDEIKPVVLLSFEPTRRYSLDQIEEWAAVTKAAVRKKAARPSDGFADRDGKADHEAIREGCAWYRHTTGEGAATAPEPDWYSAASITACCTNGLETFLAYSAAYPEFDEAEARTKFEHAQRDTRPRTCVAIEEDLGHEGCLSCPHHGKITSPIQLGRRPRAYDPGREGPIPLGFTRDGSYALRDPVRNIIIQASAQQLLAAQWLLGVAPSTFWRKQFPSDKAFNSIAAGEALIRACKSAGPFNPAKIRGRGVWLEGQRVIVNLGDPLPSDLSHQYLCFEPIPLPQNATFPTERLRVLLQRFRFRDPQHATLLLGWLAIAPICGVLSWRPHCFVYGPPKAGKSTLHTLAGYLLTPLAISTTGDSSEAGIRQSIGPDSLPVIIDEFESDQKRGRHQAIVTLARSASSGEVPILRGTPEGKALQFSLRVTFFFSGINPAGLTPADASRILLLELLMHENDEAMGRLIAAEMAEFMHAGPQWCAYMASKALMIQPARIEFELAMPGMDARLRTNIATLHAGAFVALTGRAPTPEEAEAWVADFKETTEQHADDVDRDDAFEALHHLLAHVMEGRTVGQWLAMETGDGGVGEHLHRTGAQVLSTLDIVIKQQGKDVGFFLLRGSPGLERVFLNTKWAGGAWVHAIRKLDRAFTPRDPIYFPNVRRKARAIGIPLDLVPDEIESVGGLYNGAPAY